MGWSFDREIKSLGKAFRKEPELAGGLSLLALWTGASLLSGALGNASNRRLARKSDSNAGGSELAKLYLQEHGVKADVIAPGDKPPSRVDTRYGPHFSIIPGRKRSVVYMGNIDNPLAALHEAAHARQYSNPAYARAMTVARPAGFLGAMAVGGIGALSKNPTVRKWSPLAAAALASPVLIDELGASIEAVREAKRRNLKYDLMDLALPQSSYLLLASFPALASLLLRRLGRR